MTDKRNPGPVAAENPGNNHHPKAHSQHSNVPNDCKCPHCGQSLPFKSWDWLSEFQALAGRHAGALSITADLAAITLIEAWQLYHWLSRMGG